MNRFQFDKILGNVYTPEWVAALMVKSVYAEKPLNAKIADLGCGDGNFMIEIVKHIIKEAGKQGRRKAWVKSVFETKLFGFDISPDAIDEAKVRLTDIAASYGLKNINWQLHCADVTSAEFFDTWGSAFDICVGNPPYVRVQNLAPGIRENLKKIPTTSGATDLYLAFIYIAHHIVRPEGQVCLITPRSYLVCRAAKAFRKWLAESQCILEVCSFKNKRVFPDATTFTCITRLGKSARAEAFDYREWNEEKERFEFKRRVSSIGWAEGELALTSASAAKGIEAAMGRLPALKNVAVIRYGLATQADAYYMGQVMKETTTTVTLKTKAGLVVVEKEATKKIIKASTYLGRDKGKIFRIIFPYEKNGQKHVLLAEKDLENKWPLAYAYLTSIKDILLARDKGKHPADTWYAFGRTQGLDSTFGPKILTSPMNKKPGFFVSEDPEATYIIGYGIKADCDLHALCAQLNSKRMHQYISAVSRDYGDGWRAYHKTYLQSFPVDYKALKRYSR